VARVGPTTEEIRTIVGVLGKLLGDVEMPMLSNVTIRHGIDPFAKGRGTAKTQS
jgi:hypothetical protein